MASWPSAKTSASTVTVSPTARLAGNRPASTSGVTASMTTRRRPSTPVRAFTAAWGRAAAGRSTRLLTGARATNQIVA